MPKYLNFIKFAQIYCHNVITLYDSDCAIYISPEEQNGYNGFETLFTPQLDYSCYAWLC